MVIYVLQQNFRQSLHCFTNVHAFYYFLQLNFTIWYVVPDGDIYFHLELFSRSLFLQAGGALVNEIEHDHLPLVIVILDPRYY